MKKFAAAVFFVFSALLSTGQNFPSSCASSGSMELIYHNDASRLSIKRLKDIQSPFADSVTIPAIFTDSVKKALYAIHNTQNVLVIDTIREFFSYTNFLPVTDSTHFFSAGSNFNAAFGLKEVMVTVYNDIGWGADWRTGNYYNTANDSVNYLMSTHQLQVSVYTTQLYPDKTIYIVKSPKAINAQALAKKFEQFSGVGPGNANEINASAYSIARNKNILAEFQSGKINLSYSYGCGDCPLGCTSWRTWKFSVNTDSDCSVNFISVQNSGNPLEWLSDPCLNTMQNLEMCPPSASTVINTEYIGNIVYQWQVSTDGNNYNNISDNGNYSGTNTPELHLNNIPSSWNGYKYSLLRNGTRFKIDYYIRFINNWINAVSSNWEDAGNWNCNVLPDSNTDVVIKQGTINLNSNVSVRTITVLPGATLNVAPGVQLTVLK